MDRPDWSLVAGRWWCPIRASPSAHLCGFIRARDVSIALSRPTDISVLNIFAGTIVELRENESAYVDVGVALDGPAGSVLWSRITRHSARELELRAGLAVHTLVKAVAIDPLGSAPPVGRDDA